MNNIKKSEARNPKSETNSNDQNSNFQNIFGHLNLENLVIVSDFDIRISNFRRRRRGASLVEVILAIALFGLFITALLGLLMNSYGSNFQAEQKDKASLYAQQGLEAVWSIRRQAWNLLVNGDYGLTNVNGYWEFSGTSDLLEDKYTRIITIADACRDVSGNLVECSQPGTTIDLHTKKVTSKVTYTAITLVSNEVKLTVYLTTWQSKNWIQADWSGGPGQQIWSDPTRYWIDDGNLDYSTPGEIKLVSTGGGGCGVKIWPFTSPSNYSYDPNKLEIVGGWAQLKAQTGGGDSGSTLNSEFTDNADYWTYFDWDESGREVNVTGRWQSTGGNPGGWVDISIPASKNNRLGGFWRQPFTTTVDNPTVTVNFDWQVRQYNPTPNTFQLYVFVDSDPDEPVRGQEVWSSEEITSTQAWTSVVNLDTSAKVTTAGTYYLKIAVWVETPGGKTGTGPFQIGYDNVLLTWSGAGISYPTDRPPISPFDSYTAPSIESWTSFTETAEKNGGEIYYQLFDGASWYYWDGLSWALAGTGQYNTADIVNANISEFSTSTTQIKFKAFLASDGTQQVRLSEVKISCAKFYSWPFDIPSQYIYDPVKIEVTAGVAQLKGSVSCSGAATACSTYTDESSCNAQGGCSWTSGTGSCQNVGSCPAASVPQCSDCSAAGCSKIKGKCAGTLNCSVYVDQASCQTCSQCAWVVAGACSGTPTPCSTYPDQTSCENQDGCSWSGGYPTSSEIQPTEYYNIPNIQQYSSFSEMAQKNGGEIYYQLSDNLNWYYWNDITGWAVTTDQSNTANILNTNISSFPTSTSQIKFKAFLTGDGSQQVQLDNVRIGWGEEIGAGYAFSGWLESSAFDTGSPSAFNFLSWIETIPSATEDIRVQLATAPDVFGSPGIWSDWLGLGGARTYYESGEETLIPLVNGHNDDQWVKYKVILTGDGSDTPILQEIKVNYTP